MITYEYLCHECELAAEVRHSIRETPEIACPECGRRMERGVGGGGYVCVKGGKFSTENQHHIDAREKDEITYAKHVVEVFGEWRKMNKKRIAQREHPDHKTPNTVQVDSRAKEAIASKPAQPAAAAEGRPTAAAKAG